MTADPDVELRVVVEARDRTVVERLWQLYHHDLSEFRGSLPDDEGLFQSRRLSTYLDDPDGVAYLMVLGDRPVGFVLVRGVGADLRTLGEFFVVRAARQRGCGQAAALQVLQAIVAAGRSPSRRRTGRGAVLAPGRRGGGRNVGT